VGDLRGLDAVYRAGAGEEKAARAGGEGKIEHGACAADDGIEDAHGIILAYGIHGGVDEKREPAGMAVRELRVESRVIELADIAPDEMDAGAGGELGGSLCDGGWIAGEDGHARVQIEVIVGKGEGLQQPAAEETGAAGDEEVLAAHAVPHILGVGENVGEVGFGEGGHF
jgi:hypothetical protein